MDAFLESAPVRQAVAEGVDPGCPASFMEAVLAIIDNDSARFMRARLASVGTTPGAMLDLVQPAVYAEATAELDATTEPQTLLSEEARHAAVQLAARRFEPDTIARLLQVDVVRVETYLQWRDTGVDEAEVLRLHLEGKHVADITRALHAARTTVVNALDRLGVTPNPGQARLDQATKDRLIEMRNAGKTFPEMKRECGVSESQLISVLRSATAKGLLVVPFGKKAVA